MADVTQVATRLEEARKAAGFSTLRELWSVLNRPGTYEVAYPTLAGYHRHRMPPLHYLVEVAKFTHVRPSWLLLGGESEAAGPERWSDSVLKGLAPFVDHMSPEDLEGFTAHLEAEGEEVEQPKQDDSRLMMEAFARRDFLREIHGELPRPVWLILVELMDRVSQATAHSAGWDSDSWILFGRDVWQLLSLPKRRGLVTLLSDRRFKDYAAGVLLALMRLVPEKAEGALADGYPPLGVGATD